jgi:hypothetical protein
MSEPAKDKPLLKHFNIHGALNKLERGDDPYEVFGLMFGWPWEPLTAKAFKRSYIGSGEAAKPVINTLIAAACRDIRRELDQFPIERYPYRRRIRPYTLYDPVIDPDSPKGTIKQSLEPVWNKANYDASEVIQSAKLPVFSQVLKACSAIISASSPEATRAVRERVQGNTRTISSRGGRFLRLLTTVYGRDIQSLRNDPQFDTTLRIEELLRLVRSSYPIIGQPAAADFVFQTGHAVKFEGYDLNLREMKYHKEKFELRAHSDEKGETLRVAPKKDEVKVLQAEHDEDIRIYRDQIPEIVTGCPANAELIEAILRHFSLQVRFQAEIPTS